MVNKDFKDQLELHWRLGADTAIPLKSYLKTRSSWFDVLVAAVEQYKACVGDPETSPGVPVMPATCKCTVAQCDGKDSDDGDCVYWVTYFLACFTTCFPHITVILNWLEAIKYSDTPF